MPVRLPNLQDIEDAARVVYREFQATPQYRWGLSSERLGADCWIKQHLRIKKFLGTSENAVKTQVWCAIATYVLIAIVKKELQLDASLYTCLQILSVSVFEKTHISCALQADGYKNQLPPSANQLILFEF